MASILTFSASEAAVLSRLIGPERENLPVAAARAILKLDFEPRDHERMQELSLKAKEGTLTAEERAEIDAYERVGCLLDLMHSLARRSLEASEPQEPIPETPPGILRSQQAFWRDLPELLRNRRNRGRWVAYHGDERIGVDADRMKLVREIRRRGLSQDAYYFGRIEPQDQAPWEPIEVEPYHGPDLEESSLEP
jgi:hypothetical protein